MDISQRTLVGSRGRRRDSVISSERQQWLTTMSQEGVVGVPYFLESTSEITKSHANVQSVRTFLAILRRSPKLYGPVQTSKIPQTETYEGEVCRLLDICHVGIGQRGPTLNPRQGVSSRTAFMSITVDMTGPWPTILEGTRST